MNLKTFQAPTMAEALAQVKAAMGADALILHTRTFHKSRLMGLRKTEVVEITAGSGARSGERSARKLAAQVPETYRREMATQREMSAQRDMPTHRDQPSPRELSNGRADSGARRLPPAGDPRFVDANGRSRLNDSGIWQTKPDAKQNGEARGEQAISARPRAVATEPGRQLLDTAAGQAAVMNSLIHEMASLKTLVKDLVTQNHAHVAPNIPEDLFAYYSQLIENKVADELAREIIKALQKQVRPEHFSQPEFIREKLAEQLEKLIPPCSPIVRTKKTGAHVVALIGPTGVGKTTTLAKLAATLQLRQQNRVGLITIDTYRIAAVDQLRKYAEIIGSPLRVVGTPEDLRDAVASMQDCQYILIDTAGRSPNDAMKLNELKTFLCAAEPDEVHLVLSTTGSQECVELALSRFTDVRVDKIIFTKLDEAAHFGVVLNVARKLNKSLSYITTGQDVTDDIEAGKGRRLAQLILGGAL